MIGDVTQPAAHETLDRDDRVARIIGLSRLRLVADLGVSVGQVTDHRGQQWPTQFIAEDDSQAAADGRDQ
ncbi:MAG: hypothetical protein AW12_02646 [Candidatus Accumulibacter sp. BA-94]|nr:MAG: hypothetical protein AW12_02646 [Candidatus Accumulibacter sp. BA-94]